MITKSPSGALSPYYYKGGYFHGIHYGSYFNNAAALLSMMKEEKAFILKSPQPRRILIDLYETNLSKTVTEEMVSHLVRIKPKIVKLAVSSDKKSLHYLEKVINKADALRGMQIFFCTDMEEAKTWLVSEQACR